MSNDTELVRVELVWPAERGPKDDCRAGTKTVWSGTGDVQYFPAALWHKLAPHPDVWRLVDPDAPALSADDQAYFAFMDAREKGAQSNTDTVVVAGAPMPPLDEEQLTAMSDAEVHAAGAARGFKLHRRLTPVNLRVRFLELQAGA